MIELEVNYGEKWETVSFEQDTIVIGRSLDCDFPLKGMGVSRKHAVLSIIDGTKVIRDLGSKNGTYLNGKLITEQAVEQGDIIEIGTALLRIKGTETEAFLDSTTFVKDIHELTHSRKDIIDIFAEIGELLILEQSIEEVAKSILDKIQGRIKFTRGVLMLMSEESGELEPMAVKADNTDLNLEKSFSSTIVKRVYKEKVGILTTNAMMDPRFTGKESIMLQGIRSAICAPLLVKEKTIGVIYLDTLMKDCLYNSEDLKLLSVLASFAAIGIEQVRLAKKMREEKKVRQWLSRYHSPAVVQRLVDGGTADFRLQVEETTATILFCDIVGFTSISSRLSPAEVAFLLNFFFSQMTDIIFKYQGTLDKFIGDAIMAVFGAPNKMEDHADRATKCAMEMQKKLQEINKDLLDDRKLAIRIGINSGAVVAGDIGSKKRMEYTVLGDTVNKASRIESTICKPGEIVIGENTKNMLKHEYELLEVERTFVKGVSEPLTAFKVIWK
jgi:adenylate cyclase